MYIKISRPKEFESHAVNSLVKPPRTRLNVNHYLGSDRSMSSCLWQLLHEHWFSFQVRRVSFALPEKDGCSEESQEKSFETKTTTFQLKTSSSSPFTAIKQV